MALKAENLLQDCLICGVLAVDTQNRIVTLTAEAQEALGLLAAQDQPPSVDSLPAPLQTIIHEVQKTGQTVAERQIVLPSPDEGTIALSVTATPWSAGAETACVVLFKGISARTKLDHHLRWLHRLATVGTLSASVAHEIKNAFVTVRTFVDLLLEKNPDAELAGTVRREMNRVDSLVSHMLTFAAPAPRAVGLVRLHEILNHSLRVVKHRAEGKAITFNREFQAAPDSLDGDHHQLEQAFVNLLLNSVESIGAEGALDIRTDLAPAETEAERREQTGPARLLRVRIADTGTGIPVEDMRRIFEPFFTTKQSGTGLGLAITRRIIKEHHGDIRVESQPGRGTRFTVLLPASSPTLGRHGE